MTRSQFILSLTFLCVAGTLAFVVTFSRQKSEPTEEPELVDVGQLRSQRPTPRALPRSSPSRPINDSTIYEVTVSELELQDLGGRIERESQDRLDEMTVRYDLSANQRRQIFPLLVKYHADFQDGIIANGFVPVFDEEDSLEEDIYPLLDLRQQELYQEVILADQEWWGDIIGQIREDLDIAVESGDLQLELVPEAGDAQ